MLLFKLVSGTLTPWTTDSSDKWNDTWWDIFTKFFLFLRCRILDETRLPHLFVFIVVFYHVIFILGGLTAIFYIAIFVHIPVCFLLSFFHQELDLLAHTQTRQEFIHFLGCWHIFLRIWWHFLVALKMVLVVEDVRISTDAALGRVWAALMVVFPFADKMVCWGIMRDWSALTNMIYMAVSIIYVFLQNGRLARSYGVGLPVMTLVKTHFATVIGARDTSIWVNLNTLVAVIFHSFIWTIEEIARF